MVEGGAGPKVGPPPRKEPTQGRCSFLGMLYSTVRCGMMDLRWKTGNERPGCPVCKAMAEIKKLKIEMNTLEYKFLLYREENCGVYHEREEE